MTTRDAPIKLVGSAVQLEAVAHLQAVFGLSERRACNILGADRKMVLYGHPGFRTQSCAPGGSIR